MPRITLAMSLTTLLLPAVAVATTESATYPWQLLSGGYKSSVNDGRILAYPATGMAIGDDFFVLVENSIMTMTADNGGWSRSAAVAPGTRPGDSWENSNGGRGFTDSFCGGYTGDCTAVLNPDPSKPAVAGKLGVVLAGPPSAMDDAIKNYSPNDIAAGGWPAALMAQLPTLQGDMDSQNNGSAVCIAPAGLPDDDAHDCAPGLTYRVGGHLLFASPDAGRQWYPFASSCGLPWSTGADHIAADPGDPGHLVVSWNADAGGCGAPSACSQRRIAWTGDVSGQLVKSIAATTSPNVPDTTHAVDEAGGGASDADPKGWHYAALGHLALDANGGTCDVAHAGIQAGCMADTNAWCHAELGPGDATHERFCPDYSQPECSCVNAVGVIITETSCNFPEATSLTIDPRNGAVYAPSNAGLLFSPDGGRKWRRHGHGQFTKYDTSPASGAPSQTSEWWPYALPAGGLKEANDPGVSILTMQGLTIPWPVVAGTEVPLDLNAQPELLVHLGRVSIASQPCDDAPQPGEGLQYLGHPRVRVTATLTAVWHNPIKPTQELSGVFIARGDSCTDANAVKPLVFRDTANLMPDGVVNPLGWTGYFATGALLDATPHWSVDEQPKSIQGTTTVKLPLIGDAKGPAS